MGIKQIQGNVNITENLTINGNIPFILAETIDDINLETAYDGTLFFIKETEEFLIKEEGELVPYFPLNKLNLGFIEDIDWIEGDDITYKDLTEEEFNNLNSKDFIALLYHGRVKENFTICKLNENQTGGIKSRSFISDAFYDDEVFPKQLIRILIKLTKESTEEENTYRVIKEEVLLKQDTLQHFNKFVAGEGLDNQLNEGEIGYCTEGSIIVSDDPEALPTGWYLVDDINDLQEDDKIVIVCSTHDVALGNTQTKNNRAEGEVTKGTVKGKEALTSISGDVQQIILKSPYTEEEISEEDPEEQENNENGLFSLYVESYTDTSGSEPVQKGPGYLYTVTGANRLLTQTNKNLKSNFKIEIYHEEEVEGEEPLVTKLTAIGLEEESGNKRTLKHNSGHLFACYLPTASGVQDVHIYKYIEGSGEIVYFNETFIKKQDGEIIEIPATEEIVYLDKENNKTYELQDGTLEEVSRVTEFGTTSDTAYRGDWGNNLYNNFTTVWHGNATGNSKFTGEKEFNGSVKFNSTTYLGRIRSHPYSGINIGNNPNGDDASTALISVNDDNQITLYSGEEAESSFTLYNEYIDLLSNWLDENENTYHFSLNNDPERFEFERSDLFRMDGIPASDSKFNISAFEGLKLNSQMSDPASELYLGTYNQGAYLDSDGEVSITSSEALNLQEESDANIYLYTTDYSGSGTAYYKGVEIATTTDVATKQDNIPTIVITQAMITGSGTGAVYGNAWYRFDFGENNQYLVDDKYDTIKLDITAIKSLLEIPTDYLYLKRNVRNSAELDEQEIVLHQFFVADSGFDYSHITDEINPESPATTGPYVQIAQIGDAALIYEPTSGAGFLTNRNINPTEIYSRIYEVETNKLDKVTSTSSAGSRVYAVNTSGNQEMIVASSNATTAYTIVRRNNDLGVTVPQTPVNNTDAASKQYVDTAIENLPEPMIFKGTLGTSGTITTLPNASSDNEGFTYKVITAGTYQSLVCKVGDVVVSNGTAWVLIPAGDTDSDTWRNIKVNDTDFLGNGISTGALNFKNGGHITVTGSGNDITLGVESGYGIGANQTSYSAKGSSYKVPQITTNSLGQVTLIEEKDISTASITDTVGSESISVNTSASASKTLNVVTRNTTQDITGFKRFKNDSGIYVGTSNSSTGWQQADIKYNQIKSYDGNSTGSNVTLAFPGSYSGSYTATLQAKTGTIALTSDIKNTIPECPNTTDGVYILQATVSNGTVTYNWIPDNLVRNV